MDRKISGSHFGSSTENLHLSIDTGQGQAVTDGFIFVPAGRALLGEDPLLIGLCLGPIKPIMDSSSGVCGDHSGIPRFLNALARSDAEQALTLYLETIFWDAPLDTFGRRFSYQDSIL